MRSATGVGITAVQPELRRYGDVDNGVGAVEFWSEKIAYSYSSRMMAAGLMDQTEIIGTKGQLSVNQNPIGSLVEIGEPGGVRREIPSDYYGRFEHALVTEANEFAACCLNGAELPFKSSAAIQAVEIECALQESLRSTEKIFFDEGGRRMERARLQT